MIAIYIRAWMKIRKMGLDIMQAPDDSRSTKSSPGLSVGDSQESKEADFVKTQGSEDYNKQSNVQEQTVASAHQKQLEKQRKRRKALSRMVLFPLILIISWTFGSARRLIELFGGSVPVWLVCIHIAMGSLVGFFDALVYGLTKDVRRKDKELCLQICGCNDEEFEED